MRKEYQKSFSYIPLIGTRSDVAQPAFEVRIFEKLQLPQKIRRRFDDDDDGVTNKDQQHPTNSLLLFIFRRNIRQHAESMTQLLTFQLRQR